MSRQPLVRNAMYTLLCAGLTVMAGCNKPASPDQAPASAASAPASAQSTAAVAAPYTPPSADQLYQLVAPIALFPDNLVAQVLAGSTYPDQISAADTFLAQNPGLKGEALQAQVDPQAWDASVKSLTTFPSVLDQMAQNLQWTTALGTAYANDPTDVMNAIQVMRQRAAKHGNLRSTAQQQVITQPVTVAASDSGGYADDSQPPGEVYDGPAVVEQPEQTIEIVPAQPDVVYVPSYDPETVYGEEVPYYPSYTYVEPRRYSTGELVTVGAVSFGVGILVGSLLEHHHDRDHAWRDDRQPPPPPGGGWHSWGVNWGGRHGDHGPRPAVIHNNATYVSRSTTVINRYNTVNNIDNSRRTTNIIDNSRHTVVQNRPVFEGRAPGAPAPHAGPALPAPHRAAPPAVAHGPMTMPHFAPDATRPGAPAWHAAGRPGAGTAGRDAPRDVTVPNTLARGVPHAPQREPVSVPQHTPSSRPMPVSHLAPRVPQVQLPAGHAMPHAPVMREPAQRPAPAEPRQSMARHEAEPRPVAAPRPAAPFHREEAPRPAMSRPVQAPPRMQEPRPAAPRPQMHPQPAAHSEAPHERIAPHADRKKDDQHDHH